MRKSDQEIRVLRESLLAEWLPGRPGGVEGHNARAMAGQLMRFAAELDAGAPYERAKRIRAFVHELSLLFSGSPRTAAQKNDDARGEAEASCTMAAAELRKRGPKAADDDLVTWLAAHLNAPKRETRAYVRALAFNRGGRGVRVTPGESKTDARQALFRKMRLAVSDGAARKARGRRVLPP